MTASRATWQPLLLADLRAGGRYHAAVERSGATLSKVRREVARDGGRRDLPASERLGELIAAAKLEGSKVRTRQMIADSLRGAKRLPSRRARLRADRGKERQDANQLER